LINPWTNDEFPLHQWDKKFDNEAWPGELSDLPDGAYSELLVYNLELNVAGQIDMCFIERKGKKKLAWIGDYKTNEKKPPTSDLDCGIGPLSHLNASKHSRYAMQLSMYAYILEKAGFEIQQIGYSFYKNYEKEAVEHIETPFLREECENIFALE
jgi:ATP-dependent exoDNAse (exonuclease V) beta subunit